MDLTLEEKRANEAEADAAELEIKAIVSQCNRAVGKVLAELAEEVKQDVDAYNGDWISNLETFEDELCAAISDQFETI